MPLEDVKWRFFGHEHVALLESPLLTPEGGFQCPIRREHHVKLFQLVRLHSTLPVPQADCEALCVCLDLVLPLHQCHDGSNNETGLSSRLGEKQSDGLDTTEALAEHP